MAVNVAAIGKRYEPLTYAVGREKIVEYALATGETEPLHMDLAAARAAGFADVVAPPMFAVVYQGRSVARRCSTLSWGSTSPGWSTPSRRLVAAAGGRRRRA